MSYPRVRDHRAGVAATAVGALALAPLLAVPAAGVTTDGDVVVSELHYDNAGSDTGEAVEVEAPAGTDLTGWSIVFYNGNGGAPYATADLGPVGEAGVVVVEQAGIQNGAPDGLALVDQAGEVVEFLSYEGEFTAVGGPADGLASTDIGVVESSSTPVGESLQRLDGTWTGPAPSSFGTRNGDDAGGGDPEPPGDCGEPGSDVVLISDIQGSGETYDDACAGEQTVEAVVTAVKPDLGGFYLQEEPADADDDPATSEGIFVYGTTDGVNAGEQVRVTGTVGEYETTQDGVETSQTQLTDPTVEVLGAGEAVAPTPVSFPVEDPSDLEAVEGMLVELTDTLVISEYYNYDRFGEIVLGKPLEGRDRLDTPTAVTEPGDQARELQAEYDRRTITLDDSSSRQNPETLPHPGDGEPFSASHSFRGGDTVTGVVGVVDHTYGSYRVQPTEYGSYEPANPRPQSAPAVGGSVQVASFNVLNYFLTLDEGQDTCGADRSMECRGADSPEEFERQRASVLSGIAGLDAHVVGLMEMENTPGVEPAADLVAGLNETEGAGTYDYIDTGVLGTDAIRVGMLYQPGVVEPVGDPAVLDSTVDPRFDDTKNRPMLTQTFRELATGEVFTVSVNHLKSKGSACDDGSDPTDGQGECSVTRTQAAEAIVDYLADDPTGSGDPDQLIIGDLNAYDHEHPIDALVSAGYTDMIKEFGGEHAYSYVFDGMTGYLDHALANENLADQITGAAEWHINADEPDALDYNLDYGRPADLWSPDAYRSSDHDPVLIGLDLAGADTTPPELDVDLSHDVLGPPNHKYVEVTAQVSATDDSGHAEYELVSVESNEPDNGRGDGNTTDDVVIVDETTFLLRAERSGRGDGRIYTVTYRAVDGAGNETTETAEVRVPR
ncbi:ExeM/NucH family extracellular endonuclease [Georgenia deserti]|uniref:ExeM/NucH family extracellular endonuclease n=1 Tax=Georgenia deserti TaxID=2093781 RepID=A0ABW4KYS3_9MICO